jgi:hypothetical protein
MRACMDTYCFFFTSSSCALFTTFAFIIPPPSLRAHRN